VQLRKLPRIISAMHRSKYKIRRVLETFPQVHLRRIADPQGDTGCFLISYFDTPGIATQINRALRAEGIVTSSQGVNNVVMTSWGLHLYYNIPSLVNKTSLDKNGSPWKLSENQGSTPAYHKGVCPVADSLFERSIVLGIPSCLTKRDEDDIVHAFRKVLSKQG